MMKRGIIRIISGIVLILLQTLSLIGQTLADADPIPDSLVNIGFQIAYIIGFFLPTIIGIALLIFGSRAYRNQLYSELILHRKSRKIHTVTKWVGFVLSTLLFVYYLLSFIYYWPEPDIFALLNMVGTLSFSVYSLLYMYKKPCCLFSSALIFMGVAYIYGIISNLSYYFLYLPDTDHFIPYVLTGILPRSIAGILYIVVAVILHKEVFSVKAVKLLGWTIFALEILNKVVLRIIVWQGVYLGDLPSLIYLLFVIVLTLYMSVFRINTLPNSLKTTDQRLDRRNGPPSNMMSVPASGWRCNCGRPHHRFETSCVCGRSKYDDLDRLETETTPFGADMIRFCRRCGEKLVDNSRFCNKCGTEVIKE